MRHLDAYKILAYHMKKYWVSEFELAKRNAFFPEIMRLQHLGLVECQPVHMDWLWRLTESGIRERRVVRRRERLAAKTRQSSPGDPTQPEAEDTSPPPNSS